VRVRVIDDGCRFDTDRVSTGRLGYRFSILGRIADVGASASVASTPGSGTTVGID